MLSLQGARGVEHAELNERGNGRSTFLQLRNRGQQLVGQTIFGYESIYPLERLLRNVHRSG